VDLDTNPPAERPTATIARAWGAHVLLIAPRGDPLEAALRGVRPALAGLQRIEADAAMLEGMLRGRDWDAVVIVASDARSTGDALLALHGHDPRLPVLLVVEDLAPDTGATWRALGARLVVARGEIGDLSGELGALWRQAPEARAPRPRDLDDARRLTESVTALLRAATAPTLEGALAHGIDALRTAVGAAWCETWLATDGNGIPAAGAISADTAELRRLSEHAGDGAGTPEPLLRWALDRGITISVPDLGPGGGAVGVGASSPSADTSADTQRAALGLRFLRRQQAFDAGLRSVHGVPLLFDGRAAAMLLFGWRESADAVEGTARVAWLLDLWAPPLGWRRHAEAVSRHLALADHAWRGVADGATACDGDGRLTLRTRVAERLGFGGRVGDAAEGWRTAWRLTDATDRPVPVGRDPLSRALAGENLVRASYIGASSTGRRTPIAVDAHPVTDIGGHVVGAVALLHDASAEATAATQAQAAREEALSEFRGLLDRAAELAAAMGEAKTADDLWEPLDGFLRTTTPTRAWRVRSLEGDELVARGEVGHGEPSGAQLTTTLRTGARELGTLELHGAAATVFDERHATAALTAANLLAVSLDHAALAVTEREQRRQAEEASRQARALFDASPTAIALIALDDGELLDVNAAFERLLGRDREELLGTRTTDLDAWLDPDERTALHREALAGHTVRDRAIGLRHRDGSERRCLFASERTEHGGRPALLVTLLDVTDRLLREAQLGQLATFRETLMGFIEQTLEQGFEGSFYQRLVEAAVRATPGADAGSLLLRDEHEAYRFAAAYGYEGFDDDPLADARRPTYAVADTLTVPIHLDGRRVATLTLDAFRNPNAFDDAAHQLAAAFAAQAATLVKRRALERELERMAYHDALTGLPNRALLRDRLGQAIARSVRSGRGGAALFLDLDNLKVTNDTLGHSLGDALLCAVAHRLRLAVRGDDTVARVGGDEFVILLPEVRDADAVQQVTEKLLAQLRTPFDLSGHEVHASASVGIVLFPDDTIDADLLIQHGDTAMYQAKAQGKDRYRFFTRDMNRALLERAALESHLRKALERDELCLHYQPRVSLTDGRITSVEALARWAHPERGWVPPSAFIPVAEDAGLIAAVGQRLLDQACQQARQWIDEGCPTVVAFNLSAKQLQERDMVAQVQDALERSGLEGRWLELELTESAVMRNVEENVAKLLALRRLGVHVSIDDFGTGYSSLNYLKRLPASALKIDRSFVVDLGDDPTATPHDAGIVQAVVVLAHTLGMEAIAEGIETVAQLAFLRDLGCEQGQGYLFARPGTPEQVTPLLHEGRIELPGS
jgi:diguanylate cyclase (GGDEF)-like protein/PAS domain S-box-containing protein